MKLKQSIVTIASVMGLSVLSTVSFAQEEYIACPGYKAPKTVLIGERVGKKLTVAFDAYNEDRIADAIAALKEIDPKDPFDKASVYRFLGQLLVSEDDRELEAHKYLREATELDVLNDKEQVNMLMLMGDLSMQLEKYDDAIKWYDKWMDKTCKVDEKVYVKIAKALTELKRYNDVIEPADKAIALQEEPDKNPHVLKLNAYVETKNFAKAVEVAETLVLIFPEEKLWWSQLGMMYMMVEDYPKAVQTFAAAHRQGFLTKKQELRALYQLYSQMEAPIKSAKIFKKYMDEGLFDSEASDLAMLANVYHQAQEYKSAADYYGRAAAKNPDPVYYEKRGNLLLNAEDYKGAIEALNKALEAGIDDPEKVHFVLMQANYYSGNLRAAFSHAEEARNDSTLRRNVNAWIAVIKNKAKNRGIKL